jgi:integrase
MATYQKTNSTRWMASVGAGDNRERKSFPTEAEAKAWEAQELAVRSLSRPIASQLATISSGWTLMDAFDNALKHQWQGTGGEYKAILNAKSAMDFFGADAQCSAVTAGGVLEWMEELKDINENCGSTCNKKMSALSVMLKRAMDFGGLKAMPKMTRYKESEHRIRYYNDKEEQLMLAMCKQVGLNELHDFVVIGIDTGFRRGELLGLELNDYHKGMLLLHAGKTKNKQPRSVPCSARIKAIMDARREAGEFRVFPTLTNSQLRSQWDNLRALLKKNDDPGFIVHVLRHTCCTRLVSEGVPLTTVQAWMGHKTIQTTMRYAHLSQGQLQAAVAALEARKVDLS